MALLNACLQDLARRTTRAFTDALADSGIAAPLYLTQNDGTVMLAEVRPSASRSSASPPARPTRCAAPPSSRVIDGRHGRATSAAPPPTSASSGSGFPREANDVVEIGGVRTLFRMPDLLSIGLGGGTRIRTDPLRSGRTASAIG